MKRRRKFYGTKTLLFSKITLLSFAARLVYLYCDFYNMCLISWLSTACWLAISAILNRNKSVFSAVIRLNRKSIVSDLSLFLGVDSSRLKVSAIVLLIPLIYLIVILNSLMRSHYLSPICDIRYANLLSKFL